MAHATKTILRPLIILDTAKEKPLLMKEEDVFGVLGS